MVFGFGNKKQHEDAEQASKEDAREQPKPGLLSGLRDKLGRTRSSIAGGLASLLSGRRKIDDELLEELETLLISADVGIDASMRIINDISTQVKRKTLSDPEALQGVLKAELLQILQKATPDERQPASGKPRVILMVGINGAGKTTTIGK
ncbi:MAG TPA: signal recognition particle-docking protein FtsY, partial [Gammaproteobacteria bacterium]|nr:signal recognition particle-docking protein FtsY [Gammaproteobacteria bacterium]